PCTPSAGRASAVLAHPLTSGLAAVLGARPPAGAPGHQISRRFRKHSSSRRAGSTGLGAAAGRLVAARAGAPAAPAAGLRRLPAGGAAARAGGAPAAAVAAGDRPGPPAAVDTGPCPPAPGGDG